MDREWTVDEANAALARVEELVRRAKQAVRAGRAARVAAAELARRNGHRRRPSARPVSPGPEEDLRSVVAELEADGIVLRDVDRGLIDFNARSPSGRPYLLCWVVGEPAVAWWHWPETGFAGRTPISRPPP